MWLNEVYELFTDYSRKTKDILKTTSLINLTLDMRNRALIFYTETFILHIFEYVYIYLTVCFRSYISIFR